MLVLDTFDKHDVQIKGGKQDEDARSSSFLKAHEKVANGCLAVE